MQEGRIQGHPELRVQREQKGPMKIRSRWLPSVLLASLIATPVVRPQTPGEYVVRTADGPVSGSLSPESKIIVFKGIPYAAPPVGPLRWRPPQPVQPWKGIRPADQFSASCVQHTPEQLGPWTPVFLTHRRVSEDCLYLNVWTPRASATANLPVIVFIHGGGFNSGAGSIRIYDGTNLARTGVVLVTMNYRVNIFGFFAYPGLTAESKHHSSGNYGLLDQMAALAWVKRNIRGFGGDPGRVTIWGQSAGAWSLEALTLSPLAEGLFERAQADSAISIAGFPSPILRDAEAEGVRYALRLGAHSLQELRAMPAGKLLPPATDLSDVFSLVIDGWVLPASLQELTVSGAGSHVPLVTGWQANDWMLGSPRIYSLAAYHVWPPVVYQVWARLVFGGMAGEFLKLYPASTVAQAEAMQTLSSEDRERVAMYLWAQSRSLHTHQPIYTYYFDRAIPWPQHPEYGAFHSGELPYFSRNLKLMDQPWQPVDFRVSDEVSAYLKNLAATGDPNGPGLAHWPRFVDGAAVTMQLGARMGPMPVADPAKLAFWKKYFASIQGQHAPVF
jgi:para-nitrobenzyl esterase